MQISQRFARLPRGVRCFVRSADQPEVAPGARTLGRRGAAGSRARSRDRRSPAPRAPARRLMSVSGIGPLGEAAGSGAVEKPPGRYRPRRGSVRPPGRRRIGCSDAPATDDSLRRCPIPAGLVVGDAERGRNPRAFRSRSIEPRSKNRPSMSTGSGTLLGSRPSSCEPEAELEVRRASIRRTLAIAAPTLGGRGRWRRSRRATRARSRGPAARDNRRRLASSTRRRYEGPRATSDSATGRRPFVAAARERSRPAPRGTMRHASAGPFAAAATALRSARAGRSPTARTDTDRSRTSAVPTTSTAALSVAANRAAR